MLPKTYLYRLNAGSLTAPELSALDCLHPSRVWVYDADTQTYLRIPINCNNCVRCSDKLRNDWCTRMCLHSLSYKWCYYVTLTYAPYNVDIYKSHPIKSFYNESFPSLDSYNYSHRPRWTPSILVRSHLSNFIKRLRKNVAAPLSYCACGEYGSNADGHGYGRPHFHLIVWSNAYLTKADFVNAWSFDCCRTNDPYTVERWTGKQDPKNRFRLKIGNVEFENLTKSGALDWNGIQKTFRSGDCAPDCFSYVAKYVGKRESIPSSAYFRIDAAFDKLPFADGAFLTALEKVSELPLNVVSHVSMDNLRQFTYNSRNYESLSKSDFYKVVAPFFTCSRMYAIGKSYFLQNSDRLSRRSYSLPKFQGKKLAFPTYYARLVSRLRYPLRLRQKSVLCNSLVKGSLPRLYDYYSALLDDPANYYRVKRNIALPSAYRSKELINLDTDITKGSNTGYLTDISLVSPDGITRYDYSPPYDAFIGYRYNRHTRSYDVSDYSPRKEFCSLVLCYINSEWDSLDNRDYSLSCANKLYDTIESHPDTVRYRETYVRIRKEKSNRYKAHKRVTGDIY